MGIYKFQYGVNCRHPIYERAMKLQITNPNRDLSALQIFWHFAQDTLLTGAIYILLVLATLTLRYFAELMKDSQLHHAVLEFLEYAIFLCGTAIVLLVLIYVTIVTASDLVRSFRLAIKADDRLGLDHRKKQAEGQRLTRGLKRTPDGAA